MLDTVFTWMLWFPVGLEIELLKVSSVDTITAEKIMNDNDNIVVIEPKHDHFEKR